MKDAIGYLRVSTSEQGRSGIGLAAQQRDIETGLMEHKVHFIVAALGKDCDDFILQFLHHLRSKNESSFRNAVRPRRQFLNAKG